MLNFNSPGRSNKTNLFALIATFSLLLSVVAFAQTTVGTGSIVGTVTDASGAVVEGAKVIITNAETGVPVQLTTNAAGAYNSGALTPGNYKVQASAKGFSTFSQNVLLQVGNTAAVNPKLQIGQESQVIEVQGSEVCWIRGRSRICR